jgi:hypothetical protein
MTLKNLYILEYSMSQNSFICITLLEQMKNNRTCLLKGIQHDYMPISYHKTIEDLEKEAEYVMKKMKSRPMYLGICNRLFVKPQKCK